SPSSLSRRLNWRAIPFRLTDIQPPPSGSRVRISSSITRERSSSGPAACSKGVAGDMVGQQTASKVETMDVTVEYREAMEKAIRLARESRSEDERAHPKVGA